MEEVTARAVEVFVAAIGLAAVGVVVFSRFAPSMGIVDKPGGRKAHAHPVPLVGGLAIFAALLVGAIVMGIAAHVAYFLLTLSIIIAVGLWDDVTEISPRLKFAIQIGASLLMIFGAGVELHSLGSLLGLRPIDLSIFAAPLTVFAIVGVVNAINMIDGMDGLGGSIAISAFAWYAVVAIDSGLDVQFFTALILCGAIAGFLLFNLRLPWQAHARVFMGDAGSLMIGFALGWFAIDLTQGPGRTFPPIAALWVIVLPLVDCVSLLLRRVSSGRSPFNGGRDHIHHYLLARGFTHSQALAILTVASVLSGAVGYFGWRLGLPDAALFWPFFFGFFIYHAWIRAAWKRLEGDRPATALASLSRAEEREEILPSG